MFAPSDVIAAGSNHSQMRVSNALGVDRWRHVANSQLFYSDSIEPRQSSTGGARLPLHPGVRPPVKVLQYRMLLPTGSCFRNSRFRCRFQLMSPSIIDGHPN